MVDHRAVHPVWAAVVGPFGFSSVEGRTEGQGARGSTSTQLIKTTSILMYPVT